MKQKLSKNKYLHKRLKFEEIKNPQYFFDLCTKSKLLKLLIRIFFNRENFIKFFDVRIIGSLILRDLNASQTNKSSILNIFLLLILSIFIYRLINKKNLEKKFCIKPVHGQMHFLGSQWWKLWIVEQILPNWKISSSSINK